MMGRQGVYAAGCGALGRALVLNSEVRHIVSIRLAVMQGMDISVQPICMMGPYVAD